MARHKIVDMEKKKDRSRRYAGYRCTLDDGRSVHAWVSSDDLDIEFHGLDLKAASANPRTELWIVPGCEHVKAFATHPDEWAQHVLEFLSRELGGGRPSAVPAGILATPRRGG